MLTEDEKKAFKEFNPILRGEVIKYGLVIARVTGAPAATVLREMEEVNRAVNEYMRTLG